MKQSDEKIVIVTLGNELRGDDRAGVLFGSLIKKNSSLKVIEGGMAPENVTCPLLKGDYDTIIMVDAMDFGGETGDWTFMTAGDYRSVTVSTHGSLKLFIDYLKSMASGQIMILGFQPGKIGLGEEMTPAVLESVGKMAAEFIEHNGLPPCLTELAD